MKRILVRIVSVIIVASFFHVNIVQAVVFDVNNDNKTGIAEAIYALQVVADMRPQATMSTTYNIKNYFFVPNSDYLYEITSYTSVQPPSSSMALYSHANSIIGDSQYLVRESSQGSKVYYRMDQNNVSIAGFSESTDRTVVWYSSPVIVGSSNLSRNDTFISTYQTTSNDINYPYNDI